MFNPFNILRKFQSRIGKPIRPIIELQKEGMIINILTKTIQTENMISDNLKSEAWLLPPETPASAIYIDGIFRGMGFFAGEEGIVLKIQKDVSLQEEVDITDATTGITIKRVQNTIRASYKGLFGKLLDASLIERGSALKPSMMQTLIYCVLVGLVAFMMGMMYQ
ncbi:MAG: hypothetical protein IMZ43_01500 [Thermoplasmata archaeon]|nr:hypothetical protein [Thermoplasmata archaeon]